MKLFYRNIKLYCNFIFKADLSVYSKKKKKTGETISLSFHISHSKYSVTIHLTNGIAALLSTMLKYLNVNFYSSEFLTEFSHFVVQYETKTLKRRRNEHCKTHCCLLLSYIAILPFECWHC